MKFNRIFLAFAFCLGLAAFVPRLEAQTAQLYQIVAGGQNRVLALTTNVVANGLVSTNTYGLPGTGSNLVMQVAEFDYVGLTWSYGAGSNATLQVFKSFDNGTTFESNPSFSYAGPLVTPTSWATNAALDVHGATHLAFVLKNAGTLDESNLLLEINCKSPKFGARSATR